MPFTLVAFQEIDKPADTTPLAITAVPDQHVRTEDDTIYMSDFNEIIAVYAGGDTLLTDAYLASPSLRRLANYAISPLEIVGVPAGADAFIMHPESSLPLEKNEGLQAIVTASGAVTLFSHVGVWLADGPVMPIAGEIFHVRATCAAMVAGTRGWQNRELTFDDTLPVGRYQIVGAHCIAATVILFRFVPIGEAFRPGGLASTTLDLKAHDLQRNGGLGVWCEFDQITPPSVDFLNGGTPGTESPALHIDLIKVG